MRVRFRNFSHHERFFVIEDNGTYVPNTSRLVRRPTEAVGPDATTARGGLACADRPSPGGGGDPLHAGARRAGDRRGRRLRARTGGGEQRRLGSRWAPRGAPSGRLRA